MTINDVAAELVAGCREGRADANLDKLYATDAVSVEAADYSGNGREVAGLDAIKGKHAWWDSTFEVLGGNITDPMPHGEDRFAVVFEVKTKNKQNGEISDMKEVAIYTVGAGKIIREEFFYGS